MEAEIVTPTPVETPKHAAPPAETKTEKPESIDQHANKFYRPKHRAKSQDASADDVPRIKQLTADRKAAQEELAKERETRARLEGELATYKAPRETPKEPAKEKPAKDAATFSEKEPAIEEFTDKADPYGEWMKAWNRWDRKREAFDAAQVSAKEKSEAETTKVHDEMYAEFNTRVKAFEKEYPDYRDVILKAKDQEIPPLVHAAILSDVDNGPLFAYSLAKQPALLAEATLLADGRPPSDLGVASMRRWLTARVLDGSTGASATPHDSKPAPPPPTPVRTGPLKTDDDLPADAHSLAEHGKRWGPKPRR